MKNDDKCELMGSDYCKAECPMGIETRNRKAAENDRYCDICVRKIKCPNNGEWKNCELNKKLKRFWLDCNDDED